MKRKGDNMLHFILGRVSSGKTTYLHNEIGKALDKNDENVVLIVPEQFTFETDKGILSTLGPVKSNRVDVYSFTRLAQSLFEEFGVCTKPVITEQSRLIFMSRALKSVSDKLTVFAKHIEDKAFISKMILVVNEFKQSANDRAHTQSVVDSLPDGLLKDKMNELLLICDAYDAIVSQSYLDTGDVLTRLSDLLAEKNYFKGKTVAIDGFASFNAQIMKIISKIMVQCDDIHITLTADSVHYTEGENDVFAFTRRTASRLRRLADENSVPVAKPVIINEETTGFSPYASEPLSILERNLYRSDAAVYENKTEDINIYCAADIDDECAFVARKIRQLNRSGVRCRDIAVIYRDEERYEKKLKAAFRKYEIPVFEDRREPIENQPLILFLKAVLGICREGFSTESIFRLLKSGVSPLTTEETAEIENYVYMWRIDGSKWKDEWKFNPGGFTDKAADSGVLAHLNEMRKRAVEPIIELREKLREKSGREMAALIYNFLIGTGVDKRLMKLAVSLEEDGEYSLALEQEQIWNILMETLNECALALGEEIITIATFLDMFELSLSVRTLGKVPNGIDEVTVGAASRIKTRNTDVVFVIGLNSGVFPAVAGGGGILSDKDKTILLSSGLELFDLNKYKSIEERFVAYNAVCRGRKKVFLSFPLRSGADGEKLAQSEIITAVYSEFPNALWREPDGIDVKEKIEGKEAAFELLAANFRENGYYSKNLLAYFSKLPEYEQKIESLRRASGDLEFRFDNPSVSKELFGMKMYLSASRVEKYEECPFMYFCRYGMNAQPRLRAELDPSQSGTIVHYILENLVNLYKDRGIQNVPEEERKADVRRLLREYADTNMGGLDEDKMRFNYHFNRLASILDTLLDRLVAEFSNSSFVPCEFELEIGDGENAQIPAYTLKLSDGGEIKIHGFIDRVDKLVLDSKTYLRVVDYKTGKKKMELSDVMSGLNMQMLIYLFALWRNGAEHYGDEIIPAGVLYFPARKEPFNAKRTDSEEDINIQILKNGKMNGLLLDDGRVVKAMDESGAGLFIPVKFNKDGKMSGNILSLKQLELLNKYIDRTLSEMALSLHRGFIPANPVSGSNHEHTCEYCDYSSVCCHEESGRFRRIENIKLDKCIEILEGGEE